jgi:hypothetical protein
MNRFLKLVNFEFNRFYKFYLVLIGTTILLQFFGVIYESIVYVKRVNKLMYEDLMPKSEFIQQVGTMSFFNISRTPWFMGPIVLCGVILLIYVFFIWYRDWLGKNTFSYRLLMLPTARINIYFAKAITILIFLLGLIALQLLLIPIESQILQWMVPDDFRTDLSINEITNAYYLSILFPKTITEFILYYGGGLAVVLIIFTAILFERSYRLKGVFYGILYCAISILIFLSPILVNEYMLNNYFYPLELFIMVLVTGLIVITGAIRTGNFLMNKKIRV